MAQKGIIQDGSVLSIIPRMLQRLLVSQPCTQALVVAEGGDSAAHRSSYAMKVEEYSNSNPDMEQFISAGAPHKESFHVLHDNPRTA